MTYNVKIDFIDFLFAWLHVDFRVKRDHKQSQHRRESQLNIELDLHFFFISGHLFNKTWIQLRNSIYEPFTKQLQQQKANRYLHKLCSIASKTIVVTISPEVIIIPSLPSLIYPTSWSKNENIYYSWWPYITNLLVSKIINPHHFERVDGDDLFSCSKE